MSNMEEKKRSSYSNISNLNQPLFPQLSKPIHPIGVLQLGSYPDPGFALGDVGNKYSFDCPIIYQEVEGLTF